MVMKVPYGKRCHLLILESSTILDNYDLLEINEISYRAWMRVREVWSAYSFELICFHHDKDAGVKGQCPFLGSLSQVIGRGSRGGRPSLGSGGGVSSGPVGFGATPLPKRYIVDPNVLPGFPTKTQQTQLWPTVMTGCSGFVPSDTSSGMCISGLDLSPLNLDSQHSDSTTLHSPEPFNTPAPNANLDVGNVHSEAGGSNHTQQINKNEDEIANNNENENDEAISPLRSKTPGMLWQEHFLRWECQVDEGGSIRIGALLSQPSIPSWSLTTTTSLNDANSCRYMMIHLAPLGGLAEQLGAVEKEDLLDKNKERVRFREMFEEIEIEEIKEELEEETDEEFEEEEEEADVEYFNKFPQEYQLADMFTKALSKERFEYIIHRIGMRYMTSTELEHLSKISS
ncbi:hypothetical protein Tco_0017155 [Tanacetum coccineum]